MVAPRAAAPGVMEVSESPLTALQASPSPSVTLNPGASGLEQAGAILAIVFALAAGILGYKIIRGGRGL